MDWFRYVHIFNAEEQGKDPGTNVSLDGGSTLTANNDEEMMQLLFTNPEIEDFVYPVQVTSSETGEVLTANNEEEVIELIESCEP